MRKELIDIVCCPVHKSPLRLTARRTDDHGDVVEGTLHCAACRFDYPIEEGIPNLLPPEYHLDQVKEKAGGGGADARKDARPSQGKKATP